MAMEGKEYICNTCNKHFQIRSKLETHMLVHSDKRVHKCPYCDKSYKHKHALDRHKNTHTYAKIFVCDICDACFIRSDTLNTHMLVHSEKKPNKCSRCTKSFKRKDHLRQHEKSHTEGKKFLCDIYQKNFNRKYNLGSHKEVHSIKEVRAYRKSKKSSKIKSDFDQHVQLDTEHENPIHEKCLVSCNNVSSIRPVTGSLSEEKQQNSDISRLNTSIPDNIHHSCIYANPINFHENIIQIEKPVLSNHEQMFLQNKYKFVEKKTSASSFLETQPSNTFRTEAKNSFQKQKSCVVPSLPFDETKRGKDQTCESVHETIIPLQMNSSRPEMLNSNDLNFMEETVSQKCNKNSSKFNNIQCVYSPQQEMNEYSSRTLSVHENSSTSDAPECRTACDVIIQSFSLEIDWEEARNLCRETLDPFS